MELNEGVLLRKEEARSRDGGSLIVLIFFGSLATQTTGGRRTLPKPNEERGPEWWEYALAGIENESRGVPFYGDGSVGSY